jgi:hypothetical protein
MSRDVKIDFLKTSVNTNHVKNFPPFKNENENELLLLLQSTVIIVKMH